MNTLGEQGYFAEVLRKAAEAQRLADEQAPIAWCSTCKADTLPVKGICLWCSHSIETGEVHVAAAEADRLARTRARWRTNAKARRERLDG